MVRLDEEWKKHKESKLEDKEETEPEEKISIEDINRKLSEIYELTPLEQDENLEELAKETGRKVSRLKEQLKLIEKEVRKTRKNESKEAGAEMTEKQFWFLKKNANPEDKQLQSYIELGLDFININDSVRAYCKLWLKSLKGQEDFSLQNLCLTHIANKNEDKATELIVDEIEANEDIFFIKDDLKNAVYFYEDGIYFENGRTKIKERTRQILGEAYTPQRVSKVIAKIEADTFVDIEKLFENQPLNEVPVQNGILNLDTGELQPFTPKKIFFNKLPVKFNIEAECPNIDKFFKDILKREDDAEVLYELFGYSLWKEHFIEKAFMFVGDGRNGKSKTISLLKSFLGSENCCSVPLSQLNSESSGVRELHNKMANLAGDLSATSLKDTGLFKEITGRDRIGAKRKYYRDLFFVNYSKQIFACNTLPKVYDMSEGFWDRWVLLEFPFKFIPKEEYDALEDKENKKIQDAEIINKLTTEEELSGLLNRAILALKKLRETKDLSYTTGTKELKDTWIRKSDSFMAFCLDMIEEDYESKITKKELRGNFSKYCKIHKVRGAGDKQIKAVLEDLYGVVENRREVLGRIEAVWEGIKWRC